MEKLSGDYVAGFVDGEGCFALKFRRDVRNDRKNKPVYYYWDIEFAIMLHADDKDILDRIQDALGCGKVGMVDKRGYVRYSITDVGELSGKVIPFFKRYPLQAKKSFDFELWKEAVAIFVRNQRKKVNIEKGKDGFQRNPWSEEDVSRLKEIYEEMRLYKGTKKSLKWLK